jgi:hypothetical protein
MKRLEVSGAVRPIYGSLGVKRLKEYILTRRVTPVFGGTSLGEAGLCYKIMRIFKHSVIQKFQTRATEHFNNILASV